jgi:hypothetical protein
MGATEQVMRGSVGMALVEMALLIPALSPALIAAFSLVAIYAVITAIMAWDSLYAAVRYGQHRGEKVKASVTPYPGRTQAGVSHDRRKAA